ncbi:hypothetical protein ABID21_001731 [Pseudorhizobium tarimense]|uniref:Uncharacterized protein n=1 Tax=Pseudorhizobium tarimense TaxID=1079109 RepID=A0ABV2H5U9_9HYPH
MPAAFANLEHVQNLALMPPNMHLILVFASDSDVAGSRAFLSGECAPLR